MVVAVEGASIGIDDGNQGSCDDHGRLSRVKVA
jgi:hypothetical protein